MPRAKDNLRKRPSGRWQANWRDAYGKRRYKTFDRKRDAEAFLREQWVEVDRVSAGLPPERRRTGVHTWEDLVDLWQTKKASKRSLTDDLSRIRNHLDGILAGEIVEGLGPEHVTRVQQALSAKRRRGAKRQKGRIGPATERQVLVLLQGMLTMAHREGWLVAVPYVEKPKLPQKPKQFIETREQIRAFLRAAREHTYPGLHELYTLAVTTGLRAGELVALNWEHVDLHRGVLTVAFSGRNKPTKSGKIRRVPMPEEVTALMKAWKQRCPTEDIVFPSRNHARQTSANKVFRDIYYRCLAQAGLPRMRFHDLRHTFGSHFMMSGGNIYTLQKLMGHANVQTTMVYAHLAESAFEKERETMSGLI